MKSIFSGREPMHSPCPVCAEVRHVRITRRGKPYLHCDPCGVQLFIRGQAGIQRFEELLTARATAQRKAPKPQPSSPQLYKGQCAKCGQKFYLPLDLLKPNYVNGKLEGYQCTNSECSAIVNAEKFVR
jgi:hypothetical protein